MPLVRTGRGWMFTLQRQGTTIRRCCRSPHILLWGCQHCTDTQRRMKQSTFTVFAIHRRRSSWRRTPMARMETQPSWPNTKCPHQQALCPWLPLAGTQRESTRELFDTTEQPMEPAINRRIDKLERTVARLTAEKLRQSPQAALPTSHVQEIRERNNLPQQIKEQVLLLASGFIEVYFPPLLS